MKRLLTFFLVPALSIATVGTSAQAADVTDEQFQKLMDGYLAKDENVEKIGASLEKFFQKKREEQQKAAVEDEKKQMDAQFANPAKVDIGNSPVKGNANAPITVVEFSDFECPFCKKGADTMEALLKEYPDKVKLVFKNLPLPFHERAKPAAIAALAAGKQGKFWEMHDALFNNQKALTDEKFEELAKSLGLKVDKFKADMADPMLAKQVDEDSKLAQSLGVQGTPGFFVNGVQVRGARPLPFFKEIVDRWLTQGAPAKK